MVEFATFTKQEQVQVKKIVDRALKLFQKHRLDKSRMDIEMDISATHQTIPLRLEKLAAADDVNFAHDIFGIHRHLNRNTGEIENCFLPRFSKPSN